MTALLTPAELLTGGLVPPVLTTEELAHLLRVSATQVRRMNLPAIKVGKGRYRYVTEQVIEALKRKAS